MSDDQNNKNDEEKIVSLEAIRAKKQKEQKAADKLANQHPPMVNLPPVTKYFLGLIIAIHIVVAVLLPGDMQKWVYYHLGFIPARLSGAGVFEPLALLTPITHMFLHASWIHIGMNALMMAAFATGVERWLGGKKMIQIFFISGIAGIALQYILDPDAYSPVIGASGGLSGLFAAAIIMLNRMNGGLSKYGIWPIIGIVLATYLVFGFIGSPDGNSVAWAAHIGGFGGGFLALKILKII